MRTRIAFVSWVLAAVGILGCEPVQEPVLDGRVASGPREGSTAALANEAGRQNHLSDGNFTDPEQRQWQANEETSFRAGRVVLRASGRISQVLPAAVLPGRRFRLRVDARSLGGSEGSLRLQAVWLPEGGWQATDGAGKPLHVVEAETVYPGQILQPHAIEISKRDMATRLAIFLQNDSKVPVEILQARLISLEGP